MHDKPNIAGPWRDKNGRWWAATQYLEGGEIILQLIGQYEVSREVIRVSNLPPELCGNWTPGIAQPSDEVIEKLANECEDRPSYEVAAILRRVFQTGERA